MLIGGVAAVGGVAGAVLVLPAVGAGIVAVTGTLAAKGAVATATAIAAKSVGAAGVAGGTYAAARTETAGKVATHVKEILAPDVENENGNGDEDEGNGTKSIGNADGVGKDDGIQGNNDVKDVTDGIGDLKEEGCRGGEKGGIDATKEEAEGGGGWGLWASTIKGFVSSGLYGDDEAMSDAGKDGEKKEDVENAGSQGTSPDDKKTADETRGSSTTKHASGSGSSSGGWGLWASQMKDMLSVAVYGEEGQAGFEENGDANESVKDKQNVAVEVGIQVSCDDEDNSTNARSMENSKGVGEDAEIGIQDEINNNDVKDIKDGVADIKEESCSGGESTSCITSGSSGGTGDIIDDKDARDYTDGEGTEKSYLRHHRPTLPSVENERSEKDTETVGEVVDDNNMTAPSSGDNNVDEDGKEDTCDDAENDVGKIATVLGDSGGIELGGES